MRSRKQAFWITLAASLTLAVLGFLLAGPIGSSGEEFSNPRVIGAPIVFIFGVMLLFLSPVVYELFPGKED